MTSQRTSAKQNQLAKALKSKKKNSHNPKSRRWLLFWLGMSGIAMVSATAGALLAVSLTSTPLQQAQLSPQEEAVFDGDRISGTGLRFSELTRPVNLLVMGMSVLPSDILNTPTELQNLGYQAQVNSFDGLADVMILIKFDPATKRIAMLSIPRDTRTEVIGYGVKKLNAANVDGGPALTAKSVSHLLGDVAIDRYIRINVLGVGKLIDALGGVTVHVPKDLKYQDDSQHLYINLKAGQQHLNGDQALQLLRFRHDELGDIGRVQRQQMLIRALMDQTLNPATVAQLPQVLNVVKENIDTNLTIEELLALAGFGVRTNRANMHMFMLPGRFSQPDEYIASYWIPNETGISRMMSQHFGVELTSQLRDVNVRSLRVFIQDSTGSDRSELIPLIRSLEEFGYRKIQISPPWSEPLQVSNIIAQQGDGENAELIRNALGFGEVRVESTGIIDSDVTIQLGRDWLQQKRLFEATY
ncbi:MULTISPECIES: LCP family protein [unclassified Nodularia (in: cyanobacteria)]|uniref:LCP family glycopolymer transferase n=1 Tax=unclassified Nodularia (in: cyanobacteria) TaxID=2656917 RepID=UPI001881F47A|nr:LCP family protein [Nodularia sp. LEGE 06071]MBE9198516.1 LCP family protein [Nodularia sp. LEGE 06071]MCC2691019.1 LCP family protein [Nodularia sp. LEGE 04288]